MSAMLLAACGKSATSGEEEQKASTEGYPVTVQNYDRQVTVEAMPRSVWATK